MCRRHTTRQAAYAARRQPYAPDGIVRATLDLETQINMPVMITVNPETSAQLLCRFWCRDSVAAMTLTLPKNGRIEHESSCPHNRYGRGQNARATGSTASRTRTPWAGGANPTYALIVLEARTGIIDVAAAQGNCARGLKLRQHRRKHTASAMDVIEHASANRRWRSSP